MINLIIDGRAVQARPGRNLLEAALDAGIYIPHLCSHPDLTSQGGCKMCTVEVEGKARPVQACEVTPTEGMVVQTKTAAADKVRNVALELVLAPHPKDCTSCRAYLNCELQALMQYTGITHSRLRSIEKKTAAIGFSDNVVSKEMFRCIQCGRCVEACGELRGVGVLHFNHAEGETYIGTKGDVPLSETDCRFCSACVEVCPTGSIMDAPGLFATDVPKTQAIVPCQNNCPAHTDIPLYLALAGDHRYADSVSVFREKLTFPLSLGYVCSHACESDCKRGKIDFPISSREVKRFAVENDTEQTWKQRTWVKPSTGKRVAVVGGGPAGLTGAYYLARLGHSVTVFERSNRAGGMLTHGIPKYRLPQEVVDGEIDTLRSIVDFEIVTGADITDTAMLTREYDSVLVAAGAQAGRRPTAFRGTWPNAVDGVDLCRAFNAGESTVAQGSVVTIYGGGNVAFDCARGALRAGASTVRIMCLESATKMLADPEELREAIAEGVQIINSVAVTAVNQADGRVTGLDLERVQSFCFGPDGLELTCEPNSAHHLDTDLLVLATGQATSFAEGFGLPLRPNGFAAADFDCATSVPGLFAAGDVVTGTRTVIDAVAGARRAASSIDRYLGGEGDIEDTFFDREPRDPSLGIIPDFSGMTRTACRTPEAVSTETSRCLHCELRRDIDTVKYWTDPAYRPLKLVTTR
jgi:formate dehydrogenase (NADP+) beta subunit